MVTFDGKPIYPPRRSQTIDYPLKQGDTSEQSLYDAVTAYCEKYFDLAGQYNRSAAKMAMMVLQRRLASSTFALLQSLIRRAEKPQTTLLNLKNGRLSTEALEKAQAELSDVDVRAEKTGEDAAPLLGYWIDGDVAATFKLSDCAPSIQNAIDEYPPSLRDRLTFSRELALPIGYEKPEAIFLHPGEPIFDTVRAAFLEKFNTETVTGNSMPFRRNARQRKRGSLRKLKTRN